MKALLDECLNALDVALKHFGTYSFDDKGPHEVMDVDELVAKFRMMPYDKAATVLLTLAKSPKHGGRGEYLASAIIGEMEDWDDLFEIDSIEDLI